MGNSRRATGFTLVETAMVLVIIGLLLGALLSGRELIRSSQVKRLWKQSQELRSAVYGYQDRYQQQPGDDMDASGHVGGTNGDGDGAIESGAATNESMQMFDQLEAAGFICGGYDGTQYGTHALGGTYYVDSFDGAAAPSRPGQWIVFSQITAEIADCFDSAFDDSAWNAGAVQASGDYRTASAVMVFVAF